MGTNIIMKQKTSSGYEELYPKTTTEQISNLKTYSGAFQIGDIKFTSNNNMGEEWLLCNGEPVNPDDYPELSEMLPSPNYYDIMENVYQGTTNLMYGSNNNPYAIKVFKMNNGVLVVGSACQRTNYNHGYFKIMYSQDNGVNWRAWSKGDSGYVNVDSGASWCQIIYNNNTIYVVSTSIIYYSTDGINYSEITAPQAFVGHFIYQNEVYLYNSSRANISSQYIYSIYKLTSNNTLTQISNSISAGFGRLYSNGSKIYCPTKTSVLVMNSFSDAGTTVTYSTTDLNWTAFLCKDDYFALFSRRYSATTGTVLSGYRINNQNLVAENFSVTIDVSASNYTQPLCILENNMSTYSVVDNKFFIWGPQSKYSSGDLYYLIFDINNLQAWALSANEENWDTQRHAGTGVWDNQLYCAGLSSTAANSVFLITPFYKILPTIATPDANVFTNTGYYIKAK